VPGRDGRKPRAGYPETVPLCLGRVPRGVSSRRYPGALAWYPEELARDATEVPGNVIAGRRLATLPRYLGMLSRDVGSRRYPGALAWYPEELARDATEVPGNVTAGSRLATLPRCLNSFHRYSSSAAAFTESRSTCPSTPTAGTLTIGQGGAGDRQDPAAPARSAAEDRARAGRRRRAASGHRRRARRAADRPAELDGGTIAVEPEPWDIWMFGVRLTRSGSGGLGIGGDRRDEPR
jgi:hypothetical protein